VPAVWSAARAGEQTHVPAAVCRHTRHLQTQGGQDLTLERRYGACPAYGAGLFPPDEELELLPGSVSPWLAIGVKT
jgi:hypothetical protein